MILDIARRAASTAAQILSQHRGAAQIQFKQGTTQNLVTQADLEAEAAIVRTIRDSFPEHEILGEEGNSAIDLAADHLWIVDPLDGTTNFAQGIPQFCTAIAYATSGQVQVGVVLDPNRNETFHAVRGEGAFLNDQPIRVSDRGQMTEAVIATGFYYDRGQTMRRTLTSIERLFEANVRGIRRLGSAALDQCWVACGRLDGFFEYQLSPWDYAASSIIVEEAGGHVSDRSGLPLQLTSNSMIASNSLLAEEISKIVRWSDGSKVT